MSEYPCPKCSKTVRVIIKLGGLICEECRTILFDPYTKEFEKEVSQETDEERA